MRKFTAEEAKAIAAETGYEVAVMFGYLIAEERRQWAKESKKGKKPFVPNIDRASYCATYDDLHEQKRETYMRTVEG